LNYPRKREDEEVTVEESLNWVKGGEKGGREIVRGGE